MDARDVIRVIDAPGSLGMEQSFIQYQHPQIMTATWPLTENACG